MRAPVSRSSRRGGALILALLFIGVVTAGFVSWVTLIRQRARVADLEEHQARKRLSAANSEVLARDYLLRRVIAANYDDSLNSTTDGGGWSGTLADSWTGGSQIRFAPATIGPPSWIGYLSGYALDSPDKPGGLNAFSPSFDYPYSKTLEFGTDYKQLQFIDDPAQRTSLTTSPERYVSDSTAYRGYVRSRNLLLGGDLLVLHKPTNFTGFTPPLPAVAGNVAVQGRVVHFTPEITATTAYPTIYSARSQRFTSPGQNTLNVVPSNIAGAALMVSNLAWTPLTVGNVGSGDSATDSYDWRLPNFDGQLNFIDPPTSDAGTPFKQNASNSLKAELVGAVAPTGTSFTDSRGLTINSGLATITPTKGPTSDDMPSVILSNANQLTNIVIEGQSASNILDSYAEYRSAMVIVYTQSNSGTNLTNITLRHQNKRKLLLAIKKDHRSTWPSPATTPAITITLESTVASSEWHLLILSENVPIKFEYSNATPTPAIAGFPKYLATTLRLYGGIETNAPLTFPISPGLCEINLEADPRGLIKFAPRLAWVETFLNGKL